jgi:hypothetical protein
LQRSYDNDSFDALPPTGATARNHPNGLIHEEEVNNRDDTQIKPSRVAALAAVATPGVYVVMRNDNLKTTRPIVQVKAVALAAPWHLGEKNLPPEYTRAQMV